MKKIFATTAIILLITFLVVTLYTKTRSISFGLGATGNYYFHDIASFTAPKSKLKITITSSGFVPDGADIGDGKGLVKLFLIDKKSDTVYFKTSPDNIDTIIYQNTILPFSCTQMEKYKLYHYLKSIGFKKLDKNEITELREAMTSINYGHKAGFYEGQTKYIQVGEHKHYSE